MSRPRPVLILTAVSAILSAVVATAGITDQIPANVMVWVILANTAVAGVLGAVAQSKVTPIEDPRTAEGVRLVPVSRRA